MLVLIGIQFSVALSDIKEIRIGWNTDLLRATEGVDEIQVIINCFLKRKYKN